MAHPPSSTCDSHRNENLRPVVVCDAGQWLRRMRLQTLTLTKLLQMPVGDEVVLFEFDGPPLVAGAAAGVGRARIERRSNDEWRFDALWTLGVGNAHRRGTIYAVGEFTIVGPRMLSWETRSGEAMCRFRRIVRLNAWLAGTSCVAGRLHDAACTAPPSEQQ